MNETHMPPSDEFDDANTWQQQEDSEAQEYENWVKNTMRGTQANAQGHTRTKKQEPAPEIDPDLYEVEDKDQYDDVYDVLTYVQSRLRIPKDMKNSFGGWNYRNAETIYKAVKRYLPDGASCWLEDDITMIGDRYYVRSTVILRYKKEELRVKGGLAREQEVQKGKDESQITGSALSYSRKYAMQAMFLIDDGKEDIDRDSVKNHSDNVKQPKPQKALQLMNIIIECCLADDRNSQIKAYRSWKKATDEMKKETWPLLQPKVQTWIKETLTKIDKARASK